MSATLESLLGFTLLDPAFCLLALLIPLVLRLRRRAGAPAVRFAPAPFVLGTPLPGSVEGAAAGQLPPSWRQRMLLLPRVFQILGLFLIVLAIARPVQREALPLRTEGIDMLLCIDVSSSMNANDLDADSTRLELARRAAMRFVSGRPDDRIGLIRFARYPELVCPATLDTAALQGFLERLELVEAEGPEDRTGIGTAVARAAQVLSSSASPSKVVILLTDGEENVASSQTPDEIGPLRAARLCNELGVRVYTIVAGSGARAADGQWVSLDTSQVSTLASATGGQFFEARDADAIAEVYAIIDGLERIELPEPRYRIEERFGPFLLLALALLVIARALDLGPLEVLP